MRLLFAQWCCGLRDRMSFPLDISHKSHKSLLEQIDSEMTYTYSYQGKIPFQLWALTSHCGFCLVLSAITRETGNITLHRQCSWTSGSEEERILRHANRPEH